MIEKEKWYPFEITRSGLDNVMEIDYEKLAAAITKGITQAKKPSKEQTPSEPQKFTIKLLFSTIWAIIRGKIDTEGEMTIGAFAILIASVFRLLSLIGFAASVLFGYALFNSAVSSLGNNENLFSIFVAVIFGIIIIISIVVYAFILWVASNEMMQEKDKNFILGVFSGVVAFAALIISYLQLIRGM